MNTEECKNNYANLPPILSITGILVTFSVDRWQHELREMHVKLCQFTSDCLYHSISMKF
jgi:hypothetical protein